MIYRFAGSVADLGDGRTLEHFGDSIELTEKQADKYITEGLSLLPDEEFKSIGFTDQELRDFGYPESMIPAGHPFAEKRYEAWHAAHALRESLKSKGA